MKLQLLSFLLIILVACGCSTSHVLYKKESLSRDITCIDFQRNAEPFEIKTQVGGEHTKLIEVIGFEGNKFLIEFYKIRGDVNFSVDGEGLHYQPLNDLSGTICIRAAEAVAAIKMWAHPDASYRLLITKL